MTREQRIEAAARELVDFITKHPNSVTMYTKAHALHKALAADAPEPAAEHPAIVAAREVYGSDLLTPLERRAFHAVWRAAVLWSAEHIYPSNARDMLRQAAQEVPRE